ncbi:XdhC family protein [Fictibacillus terranigra]|uniref:XdhC family protein n=1 Tax=Fictibacillus terranigra TaxID=3058424 RepID=A0ABT8E7Q4_9BACL|nr:XdhC family protein [Fictibacillus sp. CENA-BCM004]MDN4073946.1 XdhC family protein [Fictibacillus sp. CENA-BCM004]
MKEIEFIQTLQNIFFTGEHAALATIVRTRGSTPRKAGSKMIIYPSGRIIGTVGGGCGEGEVIEKALKVINTGQPVTHEVDLTTGLLYEDGGICGGIMDVFIEPLL